MAQRARKVPLTVRVIVGVVMVIAWTMKACLVILCALLTALAGLIPARRRHARRRT